MAKRGGLHGGDVLARGGRSATFTTGGAKKDDKIQINPGIMMSDSDRKKAEKEAPAPRPIDAPVMKRTARPLYDRILVRTKTVDEVSKGGIIIPEEAKDGHWRAPWFASAKASGTSTARSGTLDVKEGDTVLFGKYAGTEIKIDRRKC